jgi:hypothetical protein
MRRERDDEGSVLILTIGLTAILLLLVGVVVNVSVAALARRSLSSAADGAAVSGAQGFDEQAYLTRGLEGAVPLSASLVRRRVEAYEERAERDQQGLQLEGRVVDDTVVVTARRTVSLPFGGWLGIDEVTVEAESRARAPVAP